MKFIGNYWWLWLFIWLLCAICFQINKKRKRVKSKNKFDILINKNNKQSLDKEAGLPKKELSKEKIEELREAGVLRKKETIWDQIIFSIATISFLLLIFSLILLLAG